MFKRRLENISLCLWRDGKNRREAFESDFSERRRLKRKTKAFSDDNRRVITVIKVLRGRSVVSLCNYKKKLLQSPKPVAGIQINKNAARIQFHKKKEKFCFQKTRVHGGICEKKICFVFKADPRREAPSAQKPIGQLNLFLYQRLFSKLTINGMKTLSLQSESHPKC